jgi:hypothetical protein
MCLRIQYGNHHRVWVLHFLKSFLFLNVFSVYFPAELLLIRSPTLQVTTELYRDNIAI